MATLLVTCYCNMNTTVNTEHTFCVSRRAGRLASVDMSLCVSSLPFQDIHGNEPDRSQVLIWGNPKGEKGTRVRDCLLLGSPTLNGGDSRRFPVQSCRSLSFSSPSQRIGFRALSSISLSELSWHSNWLPLNVDGFWSMGSVEIGSDERTGSTSDILQVSLVSELEQISTTRF